MKSKRARFFDTLVLIAAIWLFSTIVLRYFVKLYIAAVCGVVIALGIIFLLRLKFSSPKEQKYLSSKLHEFFLLKDDEYILNYFLCAFKKHYLADIVKGNCIRIANTLIFTCLNEPLSLKKTVFCVSLAKKLDAKIVVILCLNREKNVELIKQIDETLKIEIFDDKKVFRLLNSLKSLPPAPKKVTQRQRLKDLAVGALKPERTRGYLFAALPLLMGAYLSLYWLYFLIAGAICLSLAILSRFNLVGA